MLKPIYSFFFALLVCGPVWSASPADSNKSELTDPLEILNKANVATGSLKSAEYQITIRGTGEIANRVGQFDAKVLVAGHKGIAPAKYVTEVEFILPGSSVRQKVSGGTNGSEWFVIHHDTKTAYVDVDPEVMGSSEQVLKAPLMVELSIPEPFKDEIAGKSQTLKGTASVEGVECYELHVVYKAENAPEALWCFSKKDFLPRKRVDIYTLPNSHKATVERTIKSLTANPKLDESAFKLRLPKGYKKVNDFAPDLRAGG